MINGTKDARIIELAVVGKRLGRTPVVVLENEREIGVLLDAVEEARGMSVPRCASATLGPRTGALGEVVGRPRKVRPRACRARSDDRAACAKRGIWIRFGCCTSTSVRRFPRSARSSARSAKRAARSSSCTSSVRRCSFSMSGGGLGVDYDGSQTAYISSMNYSNSEYARDVVDAICTACNEAGEFRIPTS